MRKFRLLLIALIVIFNQLALGRDVFQSPSVNDSIKIIEKVYLHIDRDIYYPGDDIWFKAYLIDALDRLLTDHSSNLHVELISPSSKIVSVRNIRLEGGLGNGDFKLPLDIRPGGYKIRAYTNYMRNFSDELFFTKEIIVINVNDDQTKIQEEKNVVEKKNTLTFFPEGGSLVTNVPSRISFKAVDNNGKGTDIFGKIYSSSGDVITKFKSTYLGMGSFVLKPLPGLKYYSISRGADSIDIRTELPVVFPIGVTFNMQKNQDDELVITVNTNPETLAKLAENDLTLSTSLRKEIISTDRFRLKSIDTSFVVPTNYFPDGILSFTLSTSENLPLAERLVYIEKEPPLKIKMTTDKLLYKKRESVTLKVSLECDSMIEHEGNLSLSVVNEAFINNSSQFPRSISSWFLLESDVHGTIEDPSSYFDPSNPDRLRNLDLLLRTQGWRDFVWKYDTEFFPPENGFTISGRLTKFNKSKPIVGSRVSIGIFGIKENFLTTIPVDSSGRFKLSGIDLTGEARVVVSGIDQKDRMKGALHIDSVAYNPAKVLDSQLVVSTLVNFNQNKLISYYTINETMRKKYKLSDTINIGEVHIISEKYKDPQTVIIESSRLKYGTPDAELKITEQMQGYVNLPELMKGKFADVIVDGPRNGEYFIYFRGLSTINGDPNPLVLIDDKPISFSELKSIPVTLIERIDILRSVASTVVYGLRGGSGVINLITKAGGVTGKYELPDYSVNKKISGYYSARLFYSPQHMNDSNSDSNPDLRYTLLWNPEINLKGNKEINLNYFNGDNASTIRIIGEGITENGVPITGTAKYEIN